MFGWKERHRARIAAQLSGYGLEIGALTQPTAVPRATRVLYSDWAAPEVVGTNAPDAVRPDIISDSESFPGVDSGTFDFVIANHVLEHLTNPIRALSEWHRLLRPNGLLMLALPDKRFTFDHLRPRTKLEHLIADAKSDAPPEIRNLPHLEEWAEYVEGFPRGSAAFCEWVDRYRASFSVHNHVWQFEDIAELLLWMHRHTDARFALVDAVNTPAMTNEFILLLQARAEHSELELHRLESARRTSLLAAGWRALVAPSKRLVRRLRRRRASRHS